MSNLTGVVRWVSLVNGGGGGVLLKKSCGGNDVTLSLRLGLGHSMKGRGCRIGVDEIDGGGTSGNECV